MAAKRRVSHGRSLSYLKFIRTHERVLQMYWLEEVLAVYGSRWLGQQQHAGRITCVPGDNKLPFTAVDVESAEVQQLSLAPRKQSNLNTTLLQIVTAFETFLFDTIQRTVRRRPESARETEIRVTMTEFARPLNDSTVEEWVSNYVANKWVRGSSPRELIAKVDDLVKAGVTKRLRADVDGWVRWTLVRNAIAHLAGVATDELAAVWPDRFSPRRPIVLAEKEVMGAAKQSRALAEQLDLGTTLEQLKESDQVELACELFVVHGIDDPGQLATSVSRILECRFGKNRAAHAIASCKSGLFRSTGFNFTDAMIK